MRGAYLKSNPTTRWIIDGPPEAVQRRIAEIVASAAPGDAVIVDDVAADLVHFPPAPPPPAPPPSPRDFRRALLAQLDGATRAAKLTRAQGVRERSPGLTEPFLTALAGSALSLDEADLVVAIWARIRALAGTPGEVLTAAEISRIETLAPAYLIKLL